MRNYTDIGVQVGEVQEGFFFTTFLTGEGATAGAQLLRQPVTLSQIKADAVLKTMALVRQSRLSVLPVSAAHFARVLERGNTTL